ncbi:TAF6-like RNA polymerase II p300/CBP-associated factor-associated factor 65 kDa subunit 6L [Pipistrellus kuhlii]|uniref:TAF6-like RNA polymerase II p300/CBP-associated factor-associated factor 65 kDa subunit 6L n=1 Tax=Pipistrellus kuhlii TaxID=59472 RepID=A0A7J7RTR2_PIPKU|nr:TAF6-like RNA polymerase II p300/CBP-associated factor-associated factor 65 kDa subunit 6L [Pipistrellus kuhlii]XP_045430076.1 TAF6-like RNA polymerase II p300/CBP-associated factor-associated factor 65 kDa subunit 6L [Pipistrellus kuhlii]XP_045430077.1 TAF6-like RNA polymerase II p300/CBP-associated factor-associated factor 65 kDa subunit 6L [Pipistrellus kuhlii]XP_045430078.1 TAF6-like RNA polymerase II p300/CBP-associated factor-associated factor 65 kDa subunit 6L [Pipistrellus kuhlii]XP_
MQSSAGAMSEREERRFAEIPRESVRLMAESTGLELSDEVLALLAEDVCYRLREATQNSSQFMKHTKRRKLTVEDFNRALRWSSVQAVCGYGAQEGELCFPEDREVNLVELALATNIPKGCAETAVRVHVSYLDGKGNLAPQGSVPSAVSSLTDDLLKYYQQVTHAVLGDDPQLMKIALQDLQTNSKIAALLPYFVYVVSGVKSVSHDLEQLHRLLQVARSLVRNPHLCLGPYVRSLVGSVLYCVLEPLAASINPLNDHWTLRDGAALLLSHIFWTHGDLVSGLYQQILLSLQKVLADPVRPLCSHYGAVVGLHALGWKAVERVLYPHLSTYWTNLQAVLDDYSVSNAQVKADGHKVYGAILVAVERLLKMKARAAEPPRSGPGGRRPEDLPWDSLLLQEPPGGGGAEPGFGSGLPLAPGVAGPADPCPPVTLADIYRELYAFFGDSLATRFGTGQASPATPRPPGDKKEPAAAPDSARKMPQLTASAVVSPPGEDSPRGSAPPAAAAPPGPDSRPLPRVHRARGAPRQPAPGAGPRDVFQRSRFAPRGAPHFRFVIAGRQAGRRCRGRRFQTAFPAPCGPGPASRYAQKLPMIGRPGRPARRWARSDYSLYLPL